MLGAEAVGMGSSGKGMRAYCMSKNGVPAGRIYLQMGLTVGHRLIATFWCYLSRFVRTYGENWACMRREIKLEQVELSQVYDSQANSWRLCAT